MMQSLDPFESLSEQQKDIVFHFEGSQAVVAGAGAGKTYTLVRKCLSLIKSKPDARFVAVSFTEKSAQDIKDQLEKAWLSYQISPGLFEEPLARHWVTTIHGLCKNIIQEFSDEIGLEGDETVCDEMEASKLWSESYQEVLLSSECSENVKLAFQHLQKTESLDQIQKLLHRVYQMSLQGIVEEWEKFEDSSFEKALWILYQEILSSYSRRKKNKSFLDFLDLEKYAFEILKNQNIRSIYHHRFQLVLVDEFQDTNHIQSKILEAFCKPQFKNLCVVGDPKQSIYRFRDADCSIFERLSENVDQKNLLTTNYRSTHEVLHWVNQVHAPLFLASHMNYEPLAPSPTADSISDHVRFLKSNGLKRLVQFLKKEIQNGKNLSEYVVLLREIRTKKDWLTELLSSGIPLHLESGGFFWKEPTVREIVHMLTWLHFPENTNSALVFFRSPWLRIPDSVLLSWKKEDPTLQKGFFHSSYPLSKECSFWNHEKSKKVSDLLWELLQYPELEEFAGSSLLGLWHRAKKHEQSGKTRFEICTLFYENLSKDLRENQPPKPVTEGALRVMTIHASKGLDFDRVILADFYQNKRSNQKMPRIFYDSEKGFFLRKREPDGKLENSEEYQEWKALENKKNLDESKRIFYVACTRAKKELLFLIPEDVNEHEIFTTEQEEKLFQSSSWLDWVKPFLKKYPVISASEDEAQEEHSQEKRVVHYNHKKIPIIQSPIWKRKRHTVSEWSTLEHCEQRYYDQLYFIDQKEEDLISKNQPSSFSGLSSTDFGTRFHKALQDHSFEQLQKLSQTSSQSLFSADLVWNWFQAKLSEHHNADRFQEWMFECAIQDQIFVGSIDAFFIDKKNHEIFIYDYKTSAKKQSDPDWVKQVRVQIQLYAYALGRVLEEKDYKIQSSICVLHEHGMREIPVPQELLSWDALQENAEKLVSRSLEVLQGDIQKKCGASWCKSCHSHSTLEASHEEE